MQVRRRSGSARGDEARHGCPHDAHAQCKRSQVEGCCKRNGSAHEDNTCCQVGEEAGDPEGPDVVPEQVYYYVTFDPNGGDFTYSPKQFKAGECAQKPKATPRLEGYTFDYWTLNGEHYTFTEPVTQDMTLVAHYTKNPETVYHNVHFDFNGGEVDDTGRWDYLDSYDVLVADGDLFNNAILGSVADNKPDLLSIYNPEGRAFRGWHDADGKQYLAMDVVTSDLYLTAKWSVLNTDGPSWTVYLDANGGEFDDFDMGRHISKASVKVLKGKSLRETDEFMSAATNRDDITLCVPLHPLWCPFTGWYTTSGEKWDLDTPINGDLSLTAHWGTAEDVTSMVYFKANGGKFSNGRATINFVVRNGQMIDEPEMPINEGYVFTGWYFANTTKWDFATMKHDAYKGDCLFFAHWVKEGEEIPEEPESQSTETAAGSAVDQTSDASTAQMSSTESSETLKGSENTEPEETVTAVTTTPPQDPSPAIDAEGNEAASEGIIVEESDVILSEDKAATPLPENEEETTVSVLLTKDISVSEDTKPPVAPVIDVPNAKEKHEATDYHYIGEEAVESSGSQITLIAAGSVLVAASAAAVVIKGNKAKTSHDSKSKSRITE